MDRFLAVFEKDGPDRATMASGLGQDGRVSPHSRAMADLMTRIFPDVNAPKIVAFASVAKGAGVTSTLRELAAAIEHETERRPAIVNASDVTSWKRTLRAPGPDADGPAGVMAYFSRLLASSDYVLIDCEPIDESADLSRVASLADGVVIIAEAGVTRKAQIERAVATIKAANGICLGVVLNKRRYPIPGWLYRFIG